MSGGQPSEARAALYSARLELAQMVLLIRLGERNMHDLDKAVIKGVVSLLSAIQNDADLAPVITGTALALADIIGTRP